MRFKNFITRDISWLSFNARVLQEADDTTVPLIQRIRFLGIFSNNMDEFFRVRVATLKKMADYTEKAEKKGKHPSEQNPQAILDDIHMTVLRQQSEFNRIWENVQSEMNKLGVHIIDAEHLNEEQQVFVRNYFENEVESNIIPLLIENIQEMPYLRDKSLYLGVVMKRKDSSYSQKYAIIEVPSRILGRFKELPASEGKHDIILLEDVIRFNLPHIFSYFGFDSFDAHVFKITKDADFDIDDDISTSLVQKIEKGLKSRRKGKPVRFVYDKNMDSGLLEYLMRKLDLSRKDNVIPGGHIHNFKHFMDFPDILPNLINDDRKPFIHPDFKNKLRVTDVILKKDVMLSFPYHSYVSVIDLLREAAMDPEVTSIRLTAYRLAPNSKIINALINAIRNGKDVTVMLELRARFDEEANLEWKEVLEQEGVKVLLGVPNMKVHAKLCIINKKINGRTKSYGFVSTGNLNEKTARYYADQLLLTSNRNIMADIHRIFKFLESPKPAMNLSMLESCKTLLVSPVNMRQKIVELIDKEIAFAVAKKNAEMTIKVNSLSDLEMTEKIKEAAIAGVKVNLIVRGIFSMKSQNNKFKYPIKAISIIDEYLEHARIFIFNNGGKEKIYISSADWMPRNLDHRIEAAAPITNKKIKKELKDLIEIQLKGNVKARILDNELKNEYISTDGNKPFRSQTETYKYLSEKKH